MQLFRLTVCEIEFLAGNETKFYAKNNQRNLFFLFDFLCDDDY